MSDSDTEDAATEIRRRQQARMINVQHADREMLEAREGQVWDTMELSKDFNVLSFAAPYVVARRKADGLLGSLIFQDSPRFYWGFVADREENERARLGQE